jgi:hypothetical protein
MKSFRDYLKEAEKHISPSGVETTMDPKDDDYEINYGKNGLVAKFRKEQGMDVKTGSKRVSEEEDEKKTKTKEKEVDTDWSGLDDLFKPRSDQPLARINDDPKDKENNEPEQDRDVRKKASQRDTLRATQNITSTDRMRDLMSRIRDIEADDETEYPAPDEPETLPSTRVNTENLPAVAGERLQAAGVQDPAFHKVANLPGNMSRAIRTLGKALFREFTRTSTEDVWMIGNLGGQGPNTSAEVNAVAGFLRDQGESVSTGDIDFDSSIPGYTADIRQYSAGGIRWLVVMDEFGKYIYTWPEGDSVQSRTADRLERPEQDEPRRIGR